MKNEEENEKMMMHTFVRCVFCNKFYLDNLFGIMSYIL